MCDNKNFRVNKSKVTMLRLKLRYISNYYQSSTSLFLKHTPALTHTKHKVYKKQRVHKVYISPKEKYSKVG